MVISFPLPHLVSVLLASGGDLALVPISLAEKSGYGKVQGLARNLTGRVGRASSSGVAGWGVVEGESRKEPTGLGAWERRWIGTHGGGSDGGVLKGGRRNKALGRSAGASFLVAAVLL